MPEKRDSDNETQMSEKIQKINCQITQQLLLAPIRHEMNKSYHLN